LVRIATAYLGLTRRHADENKTHLEVVEKRQELYVSGGHGVKGEREGEGLRI